MQIADKVCFTVKYAIIVVLYHIQKKDLTRLFH